MLVWATWTQALSDQHARLKAKTHLTINSKFGRLPLHCDLQQNLFHIQCLELFVHLFQICWLKLLSPTPSSSSNHCHHRQKLAWWGYKDGPLWAASQSLNLSGSLCLGTTSLNSKFYLDYILFSYAIVPTVLGLGNLKSLERWNW